MNPGSSLSSVTVIVVTYNSAHCLEALNGLLGHCPNVIISDNASEDQTSERAQALWPHAVVMTHGRNLGFGAANNRALERVTTPYALLLNPDCELSVQGLLDLLQGIDSVPDAAMAAPQLVDARAKAEVNYRWPFHYWASKGPAAEGVCCVGFLCGAALLCRMSAFEGIGFFDERFFLYYEDDDLCLRLFQARRSLLLLPGVRALHRSRGSVKGHAPWRHEYGRGYHHAQSKILYAQKHESLEVARRKRWTLLVQSVVLLPFRCLLFRPSLVARLAGRIRGTWDVARKWY